jgi:hypothetical protein
LLVGPKPNAGGPSAIITHISIVNYGITFHDPNPQSNQSPVAIFQTRFDGDLTIDGIDAFFCDLVVGKDHDIGAYSAIGTLLRCAENLTISLEIQ